MSIKINRQLSIIVNAVQSARELANSDDEVALYLSESNELAKFHPEEVGNILNRLEKDEKVIKIIHRYGDTMSSTLATEGEGVRLKYKKFEYFLIKVLDNFDEWLKNKELASVTTDEARLMLFRNGDVQFVSNSGKLHQAKFKTKSNGFLLLQLLSSKPGEVFNIRDLTNKLKDLWRTEKEIDDRKIRDAVQTTRKKLGLNKEEDMFIVDNGFGLNCTIEIK